MIEDILDNIGADDSEYESSGDEYIPSKVEWKDLEEEVDMSPRKKRGRKRKKKTDWNAAADDDENVPLATLCQQKISPADWHDMDDVPLAAYLLAEGDKTDEDLGNLRQPVWTDMPFQPPDAPFTGDLEQPPADGNLKTPYQYFKDIITDEMLANVEEQTNIYLLQKEGVNAKTTKKEIEMFIGIYLRMGLVQAHCVRAYWENGTRYPPVADVIPREKFKKLATSLHFADNLLVTEEQKADKLWKILPWLQGVQTGLEKIPPEEHHAVDEIMVPFKGQSSLKQYIRNKPHPWGFKMWGRCGSSGILYQFDVYQGSRATQKPKEKSPYGTGGDVSLK